MTRRRLFAITAASAAAATLVLTGCGGSYDSAASTAADTTSTAVAPATTAAATTATGTTSAAALTAVCVGAEEACTVKIALGGGASNQAVQVELTGTNFGEPTVTPSSADLDGAYEISDAQFTTGGSIYAFTLDAVESIPSSGYITLDFAAKS